jgi:AraC-like DNA-binding protein
LNAGAGDAGLGLPRPGPEQREWTRYRRAPELGGEAMAAHFVAHVYHRHSHDTYSFGVTDLGAQAFRCRGGSHVSTAGLVMAFNPDDPHDGHAGEPGGFTYRMVHVDPEAVREVLGRPGLPLFAAPVIRDPGLATRVRRAADAMLAGADPLAAHEALDALVATATRHATRATRPEPAGATSPMDRVRDLLHARFAEQITADELARVAGRSRFQVYRLFRRQYGLSPSAYLRQPRLRAARRALAAGAPVAAAATGTGFADQAHLTRWFRRSYGITPAVYQRGHTHGGPV